MESLKVKLKVGDLVRVIDEDDSMFGVPCTIERIDFSDVFLPYLLRCGTRSAWFEDSEFELVTGLVIPPTISPAAFKSMVSRNNMTPESVDALRVSLERGKKG